MVIYLVAFNIINKEDANIIFLNYNKFFSKFSFQENGILIVIDLPYGIFKFIASLIIDLIEKIIQKFQKEYFEKEDVN